ncbi:MAG: thermonuclease family protein [Saccharofermentans sp.]|nr:thermonuclease family protein [Saccharofermentans sp.]
MKNVIKPNKYRLFCPAKTSFAGHFRGLIPTALLCFTLAAVSLTGCFEPRVQQTIYKETSDTAASVFSGNDIGGTELPFGVKLQVDPSVLVSCELERVVDGDTLIVHDPDGNRLRVRLTGINAPESVLEDESKNTEEGRDASKFLKELLADVKTVYLEYDEGRYDQYNRTLAYVWIDTGTTYIMVNEIMLATGHAKPVYIKPNLRYADDFRKYEKQE